MVYLKLTKYKHSFYWSLAAIASALLCQLFALSAAELSLKFLLSKSGHLVFLALFIGLSFLSYLAHTFSQKRSRDELRSELCFDIFERVLSRPADALSKVSPQKLIQLCEADLAHIEEARLYFTNLVNFSIFAALSLIWLLTQKPAQAVLLAALAVANALMVSSNKKSATVLDALEVLKQMRFAMADSFFRQAKAGHSFRLMGLAGYEQEKQADSLEGLIRSHGATIVSSAQPQILGRIAELLSFAIISLYTLTTVGDNKTICLVVCLVFILIEHKVLKSAAYGPEIDASFERVSQALQSLPVKATGSRAPLPGDHFLAKGVSLAPRPEGHSLARLNFDIPSVGIFAVYSTETQSLSDFADLLSVRVSPASGHLLLGGFDITEFSQRAISRYVARLPKDSYQFKGSYRDNLKIAEPQATDDQMWQALSFCGMAEKVEALGGLDTSLFAEDLNLLEKYLLDLSRTVLFGSDVYLIEQDLSCLSPQALREYVVILQKLARYKCVILLTSSAYLMSCAHKCIHLKSGHLYNQGTLDDLCLDAAFAQTYQKESSYYLASQTKEQARD